MKFIADLHIHSHFSRATSKESDPEHLSIWARKRGIRVIGTGDFTHPGWMSELEEKLVESEDGLYRLKPDLQKIVDEETPDSCKGPTRFLPSGEISCIYKKGGKTRKVHHLILMPDLGAASRLNKQLDRIGNIQSDGRPILGLDSRDLLEMTLEASAEAFFIPAHVWTPWFSVFGSKSGFDALEECFEDLTGRIHALETGLSSDPPMNRRLSALDKYLLVSNSDAHSPGKLGREANLFDTEPDYPHMVRSMTDGKGFLGTIEFFPEEGKYHLDGHRKCGVRLEPSDTEHRGGVCPVCGRPVTVGVLHRVEELADRDKPKLSKDFFSLIPLQEVLGEILNCGSSSKKVRSFYDAVLQNLGPELRILMETPVEEIEAVGGAVLAEAVGRMRRNQVIREAGYDGEYGKIRLFKDAERHAAAGQMALFAHRKKDPSKRDSANSPIALKARPDERTPRPSKTAEAPSDPILDPLNPEQLSAVRRLGGNLLIVAGPGTGKTMTLTHRIAHLIRMGGAKPEQVLALTFTRKSSKEMAERIESLIGADAGEKVRVSTFHSFCLEVLRKEEAADVPHPFSICSEADFPVLAKELLVKSGNGKSSVGGLLKVIQQVRISLACNGEVSEDERSLFGAYQERLRGLGMLDLDDLEIKVLDLFRRQPEICRRYAERFPLIFVDEYQDTNAVQVALLKALVGAGPCEICAIGDPDQAIYGFRGADKENYNRFPEDFPGATRIELTKNYRSGASILSGAAALMDKREPMACASSTKASISIVPCGAESQEAEMVVEQIERLIGGISHFSLDSGRVDETCDERFSFSFGDIGVLYRLNAQGDALEEALERSGIPYARSGDRSLINRFPVDLLWRFFQTLDRPENPIFRQAYSALLKEHGIGVKDPAAFQKTGSFTEILDRAVAWHELDCASEGSREALNRLKEFAAGTDGEDMTTFLDRLSLERGIDNSGLPGDRAVLMSLHAAKGLEWPVVFITGCEDRLLPCSLFGDRNADEEKRLFYVGMTRARVKLILSHAKRRKLDGRVLGMSPSPFLKALSDELLSDLDRKRWRPKKSGKQLSLF